MFARFCVADVELMEEAVAIASSVGLARNAISLASRIPVVQFLVSSLAARYHARFMALASTAAASATRSTRVPPARPVSFFFLSSHVIQ